MPVAELDSGSRNGAGARTDALRLQVEEIARRQPEQVAIQVGQWMNDG